MKKADVIALVKYHSVIIIWTVRKWKYMYQAKELSNKVIKTINQAGCKKFVVLVDNETELVGTIRGLEEREKFALILGLLNNGGMFDDRLASKLIVRLYDRLSRTEREIVKEQLDREWKYSKHDEWAKDSVSTKFWW